MYKHPNNPICEVAFLIGMNTIEFKARASYGTRIHHRSIAANVLRTRVSVPDFQPRNLMLELEKRGGYAHMVKRSNGAGSASVSDAGLITSVSLFEVRLGSVVEGPPVHQTSAIFQDRSRYELEHYNQ